MNKTTKPCNKCGKDVELNSSQVSKLKWYGLQKFYCSEHKGGRGREITIAPSKGTIWQM